MAPISSKVSVGGAAGAGSVGIPVVVIWLLGLFHVPVPPEVAAVLSGWLAAGTAFFFGWLVRELNLSAQPIPNLPSSQSPQPQVNPGVQP